MLRDRFDLPVASGGEAAVAGIDHFATEVLSHGKGAASILDAAAADPGSVLANACAGALHLFLQTADGTRQARPWLARARQAARHDGASEREMLLLGAFEAWADRRPWAALAQHVELARRWPRDLLNTKIAQVHQLSLGDRSGMLRLTRSILPHNQSVSFAWGLHAFALVEAGDLDSARAAGERAVAMNRDDPWAQHAVAHVFDAQGEPCAGIAWLVALAPSWDRCSSFMQAHNWWHLALFHLARGEWSDALTLYDSRVWALRRTCVRNQVNAVSLLARLEQQGADVGERWQDLAAFVRPRIHDRQNPFLDLHFAYALARAGDDAAVAELLVGIGHAGAAESTWRDVALPAARGVVAHARRRTREAAAELQPLTARMHLLGGSTAQQGWFAQMRGTVAHGASSAVAH